MTAPSRHLRVGAIPQTLRYLCLKHNCSDNQYSLNSAQAPVFNTVEDAKNKGRDSFLKKLRDFPGY